MKKLCLFLFVLLTFSSCIEKSKEVSPIFHTDKEVGTESQPDLADLEQTGEIIAVTLSGPDTYFELRGQSFGEQYEMVADFARSKGLRIRMEIAHDTTELITKLQSGEADIIALPMPAIDKCLQVAIQDSTGKGKTQGQVIRPLGWLTRTTSPELAEALNKWYSPDIKQKILAFKNRQRFNHSRPHTSDRNPTHRQPKIKDASRGIISDYDDLFRQHAGTCGWDWKLLAAQCYQESAFDPNAVSWAGAQGLMQLMPSTARHYGVAEQVFDPEQNIAAATRMIANLNKAFQDIANDDERINFILASYNGGQGHVRDAMALTKKYGGNQYVWADVQAYILALSDPQYYRDPIVKCGYLRGTETSHYVSAIRSHWSYYHDIR